MKKRIIFLFVCFVILSTCVKKGMREEAPPEREEKTTQTLDTVYAHALRGEIRAALSLLHQIPDESLEKEDQETKKRYLERFEKPFSLPPSQTEDPFLQELILAYQHYWRRVMREEVSLSAGEKELFQSLESILSKQGYLKTKPESFDVLLETMKEILSAKGYYAIMGTTLPYRDLMLWNRQTPKTYVVPLVESAEQKVPVIFLEGFLSLGWTHFATFGKYYTGGWVQKDALYCVKESYDIYSEKFYVSYLAHEAKHFSDNKLFPKLEQPELEYRAKLVELVLSKKNFLALITRFANNAKNERKNPHQYAEYWVVSHMSRALFGEPFVSETKRWESVPIERFYRIAKEILLKSTEKAHSIGKENVKIFLED